MADITERVARLEGSLDTLKADSDDYRIRLRKIERLMYGVIGAAAGLSWIITQANNINRLTG